jgi:hypothetical protein
MSIRSILLLGALAAAAAAPSTAAAATTVAADPAAQQVTALDGTVVWVSGAFGDQVLMQHTADGATARVAGSPAARSYPSIDLGHDARGRLVLTYKRCATPSDCVTRRDDLQGHRTSIGGIARRGCTVTTAPAMWRASVAYGLSCQDRSLGGLWVKTTGRSARHLPRPADARRYGALFLEDVDLRASQVAAVTSDIYAYAFTETITGKGMRAVLAAASEGESDEHVRGVSVGAGGTVWALTNAEHVGDPNLAIVRRVTAGCDDWQTLANDPGPQQEEGYRATALAVDGSHLYLIDPQTGIVRHDYAADRPC